MLISPSKIGLPGLGPSLMAYKKLGLLADDFTGAMDAGAQLAGMGIATAFQLAGAIPFSPELLVINSKSRDLPVEKAVERVAEAVVQLEGRNIFKKIDSTLRGNIGPEIRAVLAVCGICQALLCPTVPELGRVVRDGKLWVGGSLLHESDFRFDPTFPAKSSSLAEIAGEPVERLALERIRSGSGSLGIVIQKGKYPILAADAETTSDLDLLVRLAIENSWLPCGALALGRAWGRVLRPFATSMEYLPPLEIRQKPFLFVVGSHHPTTRGQYEMLIRERGIFASCASHAHPIRENAFALIDVLQTGYPALFHLPMEEILSMDKRSALMHQLVETAAYVLQSGAAGGVVVCGGETAAQLCDLLETEWVSVLGEFQPGVAIGQLKGGHVSNLTLVTKAGGFGDRDVLVKLLEYLCLRL